MFGKSILAEFNTIRENNDSSRAYAANKDKILLWLLALGRIYKSSNDPLFQHFIGTQAAYAQDWSFAMLDPKPENRPTAGQLVEWMRIKHSEHHTVVTGCPSCTLGLNHSNILPAQVNLIPVYYRKSDPATWNEVRTQWGAFPGAAEFGGQFDP